MVIIKFYKKYIMKFDKIKEKIFDSKLLKDSFWSLFGNVMFRGLSLISGIFIARMLGKDIFGEYSIIKNTILSMALFSTFGLGYTSTKYVAEYKNIDKEKLKSIVYYSTNITLVASGIVATILFFNAKYVSEYILGAIHLTFPLKLLSILVILNALTAMQVGVLAGLGKFRAMAHVNMIVGIFTFILSIILTYFFSFNGAMSALLVVQVLNWYLNRKIVAQSINLREGTTKKSRKLLKEIISFSTPIALQEAVYSTIQWTTGLVLIKWASFGELGLYTASMQWNAIILFIPGVLRNVVLSHLSQSSNNEKHHAHIMSVILLINFIMTFIPSLIICILSGYITQFYGNSFHELQKLISISVFISVFASISNVYSQAYMSKGMNWTMFIFRFIRDAGTILMFFTLIKYFDPGSITMIYSHLALNIIFMIIMIVYYKIRVPVG